MGVAKEVGFGIGDEVELKTLKVTLGHQILSSWGGDVRSHEVFSQDNVC